MQPAKVAAFAEEFQKHSTARLDLYTWAWAAERIDPAPFGGRLWLPDFGANPVFKNYVAVVEVTKVKGWTVIANQYGDRFQPATGGNFDINKHLGGMWAARAAASQRKEWSDMATEKQIEDAAYRGSLRALQRELTYKREKLGEHAGGSVSLQDEILTLASNFGEMRTSLANLRAATAPSTLRPLLEEVLDPAAGHDVDDLTERLSLALLRNLLVLSADTTPKGA